MPTVAGVLGVTPQAISARMARVKRRQWRDSRRQPFRVQATRSSALRGWWRNRMRAVGVEPLDLTPDDPAWHYCHKRPRGWAVREVADAMRAEGHDLRLADAQAELLRRVEALTAAHLAPLRRTG